MTEHRITVKSLQEWRGVMTKGMLGSGYKDELELQKEVSLSLECTCGDRFYKFDTAKDHLKSV